MRAAAFSALIAGLRTLHTGLASGRGQSSVGSLVRVSLFIAIILLANGISAIYFHRFDLTGLSQFTLTSQTKRVLADLDRPVEAVSFFSPGSPAAAVGGFARNLLDEYRIHTKRLTVRNIDPDLNPDQARRYGVEGVDAAIGVIVFSGDRGKRKVLGPEVLYEAEHAFTSAILEVTGTIQKKVYFLTGHGEHDIYSDYDNLRRILKDNLFQVEPIDLSVSPVIPRDASAIVVAAPRQPLGAGELDILRAYLKHDGSMFVLVDPGSSHALGDLLLDWSLRVTDGTVMDPASYVAPNQDIPLVPRTRNGFQLAETYFPGATALTVPKDAPSNLVREALVMTSDESWLDRNFSPGKQPKFDGKVDKRGSFVIGALVSSPPRGGDDARASRLAVIGDSDFVANTHVLNANNGALFLKVVAWLTNARDLVSVDRKVLTTRRLIIGPEEAAFLQVSAIGMLPLLVLLAGGLVWWRRR